MLTADQKHCIRKLIPQVQAFLNEECNANYTTKMIQEDLTEALETKSVIGMVKMEVFELDNVEGIRIQYGNAVKYLKLKSEGK